ncbi:hypothetical protein AEA09_11610 [Lysinibacillus contaminans]|uniref:Uncharacterized protein n=2 Tax=Lysinibacillus contaminans TaxID=1293441 RepID=A0ABR5K4I8_9BACI|nr:hypothetical protein [Lysinibacillus contaminans]KOS69843.1 hypothetical protein AEA09_11610 [Lysinibacillus contaminans]
MVQVQGEEVEVDNIYVIMPPSGTIIGEATEKEMEKAAELECRHMAFLRLQDMNLQVNGDSYKELLNDFLDFELESSKFWRSIANRIGLPYEWPIRIDHANGPIYMGQHEFDVEPDAEDEA